MQLWPMTEKQLFIPHVDYAGGIGLAVKQKGFNSKKIAKGRGLGWGEETTEEKTRRNHKICFAES